MRKPLEIGTMLRLYGTDCYRITGKPVGEGGGSLLYPAVRCVLTGETYHDEPLKYVLKECYPQSSRYGFVRSENGEIISDNGGDQAEQYLNKVKEMQMEEKKVTGEIYQTGFRLTPILGGVQDIELSFDGGKSFHRIHNTVTVMESLAGKGMALKEYLENNGRIPLLQALEVIGQVLMSLNEVHNSGYLHLDIQDGNVFIKGSLEDNSDFVSLIDFGSARKRLKDGKCAEISDRVIFSTKGFAAPEMQYGNDGSLRLGPEADIYSTGYLLLFMLRGRKSNPEDFIYRKNGYFLRARELDRQIRCPRHLQDKLQKIIARALDKNPENRYHSAEDMRKKIFELKEGLNPCRSDLANTDYDAFISYSHRPVDQMAAEKLQKYLEHFYMPGIFLGKTAQKRIKRVFLDKGELSSGPDLKETLHTALKNSGWLILICSSATGNSDWVNEEIEYFLQYHDRSRILAVLIEGEPQTSFPPLLLENEEHGEVIAADARKTGHDDGKEMLRKLKKDAVLRIAAPILGTTYDNLKQRYKRYVLCRSAAACSICFLIAAAFLHVVQLQQTEKGLRLAEYSDNALLEGNVDKAVELALDAVPAWSVFSSDTIEAAAQKALTSALGVYDLSDGFKTKGLFELPSKPLALVLSPDGGTASVICSDSLVLFNTDTGDEIRTLPVVKSALSEVKYLNNHIIIYAGKDGVTAYDIDADEILWTGQRATAISISADGTTVAAVYRDENYAVLYESLTGTQIVRVDFQGRHQLVDPNDSFADLDHNLFSLNKDGTILAVSFDDGSLTLYDTGDSESRTELLAEGSGASHFEGGFYSHYFAVAVSDGNSSVFGIFDTDTMEQTCSFTDETVYHVVADEEGIWLQYENHLIKPAPDGGEQLFSLETEENMVHFCRAGSYIMAATETGFRIYNGEGTVIAKQITDTGCDFISVSEKTAVVGSLDSAAVRILSYETFSENRIVGYDAEYDHAEARISADGKTVMLFSYKGFQIIDRQGRVICEIGIPDAEQVFDQQFIRNGDDSYLEVTYYDGTVVQYSARDGLICGSKEIEEPDPEIVDVFETDHWRIRSSLKGSAQIYDIRSGKLTGELKEDAYLTYVTQLGDNMILQYFSIKDGYFYGQLVNDSFQVLAELPWLCDVYDGVLYFDYPSGDIRQSEILNYDELKEAALR